MKTATISTGMMACVLLIVLTGAFALSQAQQSPVDRAVNIVRTLNTAEADSMLSQGHFLNLSELPAHRFVSSKGWSIQPTGATTGTLDDYGVILTVTADRKHYQLSMLPTAACGVAVFSDDSGLIYTGRGLECS